MKTILSVIIILLFLNTGAKSQDTLFVHGFGGPETAMEAATKVFAKKNSIPLKVIAGPEQKATMLLLFRGLQVFYILPSCYAGQMGAI